MAYAGNDSDEYLPDSDDSNDEDERPNRWSGPPSTWQQLNSAEIDTLSALNKIRNQDLSTHLYNAFALKHRHSRRKARDVANPVPNQDVDTATGQPVQEDKWVPPNAWTAWPLPANAVPRPEFMGRTDPADEDLTFRMQTPYRPKTELEEAVSATMLRFAKEKFQARQAAAQRDEDTSGQGLASGDEEDSSTEMSSAPRRAKSRSRSKLGSKSRSVKYESASEGEMIDIDGPRMENQSSTPPPTMLLKTVVATDDELSYTLLRPSVRAILAKLDTTLVVLHNAQESKMNCPSESEASDASSRSQSCSRSRSRGVSKMNPQSPDAKRRRLPNSRAPPPARESAPPGTSGEREYGIRIARLRKKPIPFFPDDGPEPVSDSTPAPTSAAEYTDTNANAQPKRRARRPRRRGSEALSDITSASGTSARSLPRLSRVRLRDWRDILGAAALAGFPAQALDRAARRCADLFGQSFTLHTLQEAPPDRTQLDEYVHYHPGMTAPYVLEDSEDDDDQGLSRRPRTQTLRAASAAPSEGEEQGRRRGRSSSIGPRSRSRSRSASVGGAHFCIVSNCPRAARPFSRREHLQRHMKLVHKYNGGELLFDVDSGDEMHGAVHVDGFLKPIKVRPGWRGDDVAKEKRRPQTRARGRETLEIRMRDADSATDYEVSD
ncbi:hypothetical protein EKO27_g4969 [Xylaria grammica]|uniref:Rrn9 domain-containing protein n=1 Tax=Xylaria grammica TaxID=363999 RepID=A0A439D6V4_9PEZI|nr:hypothetical protein EKO27_g4969 [Xylaria grammica]